MSLQDQLEQINKKAYGILLVVLAVLGAWLAETWLLLILFGAPGGYLLYLDSKSP